MFGNNGGVQGSRMSKNAQRGDYGGDEVSTLPVCSRSSSMRKNGGDDRVSQSEFSPGLLDLHSCDTELLSEVC